MILLVLYLMFVIISLLTISYLVTKLDVPNPHLVMVVIAVVIVSPILIGYFYSTYIVPVSEVAVPNVTNLTVDEAAAKLKKAGLSARVAEKAYERNIPDGRIISQRPEPGNRVKTGRMINLKISIGERMVEVPNLVGRDLSQIEVVLNEAGLKIGGKKIEISEQYQNDVVINQYPPAGDEVGIGSRVDIILGENPNFGPVKVPNVVSKSIDEARETLGELKLNCIIFYHETKQFKVGTVISQEPIEGEELKMGDAVKLYVSTTPTSEQKTGR